MYWAFTKLVLLLPEQVDEYGAIQDFVLPSSCLLFQSLPQIGLERRVENGSERRGLEGTARGMLYDLHQAHGGLPREQERNQDDVRGADCRTDCDRQK